MRLPFFGPVRPTYLAVTEYWLYLPKAKLPPQEAYMNRMMRVNPFQLGDQPPTGPAENLLFSDIRLGLALVLRQKNAHAFRPDLFDETIEPTAEALEALGKAEAFVKCSYVSDVRLKDDRHLQFMVYLVEAIAALTRAQVAFDPVTEELFMLDDLRSRLREDNNARRPDLHLRTTWRRSDPGGVAEVRGLSKIGLPEWETPPASADHRVLIEHVLDAAARQQWDDRELLETRTVRAFDDDFQLALKYKRKGPAEVRISRIHR